MMSFLSLYIIQLVYTCTVLCIHCSSISPNHNIPIPGKSWFTKINRLPKNNILLFPVNITLPAGKSLQPKFGMLTIALEPFFDARVSDVAICPITLSYEKTVEENLHVRELMGIPKPKESTTGLIKARAILDNNYGRIHVKAGKILSVYDMAVGKVNVIYCG